MGEERSTVPGAVPPGPETAGDVLVVVERRPLAQSLAAALGSPGVVPSVMTEPGLDGSAPPPSVPGRSVAVLDAGIGASGDGAALTAALVQAGWTVVVLWGSGEALVAAACLESGAVTAIAADASLGDVVAAVSAIRDGEPIEIDRVLRDQLLSALRRRRRESARLHEPFGRLTPRERQVLEALTEGRRADQIATDWVVSVVTVRNQIQSVLTKLGVGSQLEAVALARQAGWPPPSRASSGRTPTR